MNNKLIIGIVVVVGIAYLFIGPDALWGLVAAVFGFGKSRTTGEIISSIEGKIEDSQQRQDRAEAESIKASQEASESNKKAQEAVQTITDVDYDLSGGYTKHTDSSDKL